MKGLLIYFLSNRRKIKTQGLVLDKVKVADKLNVVDCYVVCDMNNYVHAIHPNQIIGIKPNPKT